MSETPAEVKHYNDIWWHTAHHIRHTRELSGEAVFAESEAIARRLTELQEQRDHALAELLTLQARATTPDTARTLADLQQAIYDLTDPCGDEGTVETIIETLKRAMDVVLAGAVERDALKLRVAELVEMQNVLRGRLIEAEHKRAAERAHPTITRETLVAYAIVQETPEEQARAIWWLRDAADEAADTLGLTYAEPCAGDGCDGVALDSTESALCAECAAEAGGTQ